MDQYLDQTLGIAVAGMRQKIINEGFRNLRVLVNKDKAWVESLRLSIKKSTTGNAAHRDITLAQGELLWSLVAWSKMRYMTQRPLVYADATLASITAVFDWYEELEAELPDTSVATFSPNINRRSWFESIQSFLGTKKGKAGVPLTYVLSSTGVIDPAVPDPGFGLPSFQEDLATRGRHDGTFWAADNNTVWRLLELKCRDTDAWSTIAAYEATRNGAQAYNALSNQYMGQDIKRLLRTEATNVLQHSWFDGQSKNYTFEQHVNKYRRAFIDLGPADAPSQRMRVELFMNSWQVPGKEHLGAIVRCNDEYKNSFESTVAFLAGELAASKTKNVSVKQRSVAKVTAQASTAEEGDDNEQEEADSHSKADSLEPEEEEQAESEPEEQVEPTAGAKRRAKATTVKKSKKRAHSPSAEEDSKAQVQQLLLELKAMQERIKELEKKRS